MPRIGIIGAGGMGRRHAEAYSRIPGAEIAGFADEDARRHFRWQGLFAAPLVVVVLSHKQAYLDRYAEPDKGWVDRDESRWPVPYWDVDCGFATMAILLTAVDEGLGALFFGIFDGLAALRAEFGIPPEWQPIGAVALGWPAPDEPSPSLARGRRPEGEVVHRGHW